MRLKSFLTGILLFTALALAMNMVQVNAEPLRDVAILDVVPNTNKTYVGWSVFINVTVQNNGNVTDTFDVNAYYGNATGNYTIGTLPIELDPGENGTLIFEWNTKGVQPCQNYTIKANCTLEGNLTPEDNEFVDGNVKITIFADINGDGKVDAKDFVLIGKAVGSIPGHRRWDPDADLNDDEKVNVIDVVLLIKEIGKSCV